MSTGGEHSPAAYVREERLWKRHMEMARFGATSKGGVNRQALTQEEIEARGQLVDWALARRLQVFVDPIANLFIRKAGEDPVIPAVLTGSHIDTQPTGGKFDGIYGVLAGLEAVEAICESGLTHKRSIEVVAWTNEEGSRFSPGMMGSEAYVGVRTLEDLLATRDASGVTVADALSSVLSAASFASRRELGGPVHAFVEAHIEQGPILEEYCCSIGVVTGIQGVRRFRVFVSGEEAHAGTTSRLQRRDAMMATARMAVALENFVQDYEDDVRFTIGMVRPTPNVPSVVASEVEFSIDLRHPKNELLASIGDQFPSICRAQAANCEVDLREIASAAPLHFQPMMVELIETAANRLGFRNLKIFSGAGHDARQLHSICPTGMIFVPCEKGISHNEAENARLEDLSAGTRVLAEVLLQLAR